MSLQPSFVYICKIEFQKKLGSQVSPKVFNPLWKINCTFRFFQVLVFLSGKNATLSSKGLYWQQRRKKWIKENWTGTQPMLMNYVSKFNIGHINIFTSLNTEISIMIKRDRQSLMKNSVLISFRLIQKLIILNWISIYFLSQYF